MQPYELTLADASAAMHAGRLSPVELVDSMLDRIEHVEPLLGAYVTVTADRARAAARQAEREIARRRTRGALHGIPVALKDLIDVAGLPTTASSRVRTGHRAEADSAVTARLAEAGTALLGKTHTHEFAYGLTTPQTRNAWNPERVAGGSSGGSAVAVAAGAATFALGTDTGGSIRVPAALNGVVGLKPTYGLVSRHGVTALSWSLDHVGPITRTVADAALALTALAGSDPRDAASLSHTADYRLDAGIDLRGLRIGVPVNYYFDRIEPAVETAVRTAIDHLSGLGAALVEIEIPMARYIKAIQWGLMVPEASAVHEHSLRSAPDLYGPDVRNLLEAGMLSRRPTTCALSAPEPSCAKPPSASSTTST
ncbi:amidase [Nocardia brasiliensis]|uniref:amidase n=1 Tax=Nocardia brasiliensis TaxID=37326 RepID=UPI002456144F|nr:amidase [Nocardia brasiliensis]